ncbi:MAG: hypothetical protein QM770_01980 [Tepidisphaeraceae bacterium]
MAQVRKYGVNFVLAGQYLEQQTEALRQAVLGNASTIIAFRCGETDARVLAREFGEDVRPEQFLDLPNHEVFVKMLDQGVPMQPFHGRTLPPIDVRGGHAEKIARLSRQRYGRSRAEIEGKIAQWFAEGRPPIDRRRRGIRPASGRKP